MDDVESRLWALEREFWLGGADVYRKHLADESQMIFPGMVLTKAQTVESIAAGPGWTAVVFSDRRIVRLISDVVGLIYRASGSREQEPSAYSALVSSIFVKRNGEWKLALHQQSPSEGSRA